MRAVIGGGGQTTLLSSRGSRRRFSCHPDGAEVDAIVIQSERSERRIWPRRVRPVCCRRCAGEDSPAANTPCSRRQILRSLRSLWMTVVAPLALDDRLALGRLE